MHENSSEAMNVTEHVREAWRLLLNLPDGERERVTQDLSVRFAWSEVEAETTAMRRASLPNRHHGAGSHGMHSASSQVASEDELAEITANLTRADVAKVRTLIEALRDGVVTIAELHKLPDREWMGLIASRASDL
jgi:O-succinylbenzoate synthase